MITVKHRVMTADNVPEKDWAVREESGIKATWGDFSSEFRVFENPVMARVYAESIFNIGERYSLYRHGLPEDASATTGQENFGVKYGVAGTGLHGYLAKNRGDGLYDLSLSFELHDLKGVFYYVEGDSSNVPSIFYLCIKIFGVGGEFFEKLHSSKEDFLTEFLISNPLKNSLCFNNEVVDVMNSHLRHHRLTFNNYRVAFMATNYINTVIFLSSKINGDVPFLEVVKRFSFYEKNLYEATRKFAQEKSSGRELDKFACYCRGIESLCGLMKAFLMMGKDRAVLLRRNHLEYDELHEWLRAFDEKDVETMLGDTMLDLYANLLVEKRFKPPTEEMISFLEKYYIKPLKAYMKLIHSISDDKIDELASYCTKSFKSLFEGRVLTEGFGIMLQVIAEWEILMAFISGKTLEEFIASKPRKNVGNLFLLV